METGGVKGDGVLMLAVWTLTSSVSLSISSAWVSSWRSEIMGVARAETAKVNRAKKAAFILAGWLDTDQKQGLEPGCWADEKG